MSEEELQEVSAVRRSRSSARAPVVFFCMPEPGVTFSELQQNDKKTI